MDRRAGLYNSVSGATGDRSETGGGHWCGFSITPSEEDLEPVYTTRCAILPPQAAEATLSGLDFRVVIRIKASMEPVHVASSRG